jgi:protein dpy-30
MVCCVDQKYLGDPVVSSQEGQSKESEQQQQQSGESKQKKAEEQEEQVEQQPFPGQQSHSQSLRQYLDSTVVPLLRDGLKKRVQDRPEEPVQWLIEYLQNHKDEQSPKSPHQQQNEQ